LDYKKTTEIVENNHDQKFWRDKMLVGEVTWDKIQGKSKLQDLLKYMPEKFRRDPLRLKFKYQAQHLAEYEDWLWDYKDYLIEICKEPDEGLWDKISAN